MRAKSYILACVSRCLEFPYACNDVSLPLPLPHSKQAKYTSNLVRKGNQEGRGLRPLPSISFRPELPDIQTGSARCFQ